jgi:RNA polymerase sigma factor (sigma-70 family)
MSFVLLWCNYETASQMSAERHNASASGDPPALPEEALSEEERPQTQLVEHLFREHNAALIRFLHARLRSYQEACEVAQEAYVRVLSLDKPGAVNYLRAFLFKTAANIAIDRRRRHEMHDRATELPFFHESEDRLTPERRLAGKQTLRRLEQLIATLPPKCQQAFVLNQIHGLDFAAVARQMRLSESMVRKYVMRAMLHCRTRLDLDPADDSTGQELRDE